jgi:hypothetical protein
MQPRRCDLWTVCSRARRLSLSSHTEIHDAAGRGAARCTAPPRGGVGFEGSRVLKSAVKDAAASMRPMDRLQPRASPLFEPPYGDTRGGVANALSFTLLAVSGKFPLFHSSTSMTQPVYRLRIESTNRSGGSINLARPICPGSWVGQCRNSGAKTLFPCA